MRGLVFALAMVASACGGVSLESDDANGETCLMLKENSKFGFLATGGRAVAADANKRSINQALQHQVSLADASGYATVQFGIGPPPAGGYFVAEATVVWSVGGTDITRRVSVVNGTVISGAAENVKVKVQDVTNLALAPGPTANQPHTYGVNISVIPGCRPSQQQPPRLLGSQQPISLGTGLSTDIDIPQDAGVISVNLQIAGAQPITSAKVTVEFFVAGVLQRSAYDYSLSGPSDWVPIPPGASILRVTNATGGFIFITPTWGIEG